MIDDHFIVATLNGRERLPVNEVIPAWMDSGDDSLGRFRPLFWLGQVLECAWAGNNPLIWYVDRLALAVLALAGMLVICRAFVGPWAAGLVTSSCFFGPQFETWSRLAAAEAYSIPLFTVGCALVLRGWQRQSSRALLSGTALVVGSALAKESLIPAAAALLLVLLITRRLKTPLVWLSWAGLTAIFVVDVVVLLVRLQAYGSQYGQERTVNTVASWAGYFTVNTLVFQGVAFALVMGANAVARGRLNRSAAVIILISSAFILVQVVFYAGAAHVGRYLLPAVLGIAIWWLVILRQDTSGQRRSAIPVATIIGQAGLALALCLGGLMSFRIAAENARVTRAFDRQIEEMVANVEREQIDTIVLQPGEPEFDLERVISLARYLHARVEVTVMTTEGFPGATSLGRKIAPRLRAISTEGMADPDIAPLGPTVGCLSVLIRPQPSVCPTSTVSPGS